MVSIEYLQCIRQVLEEENRKKYLVCSLYTGEDQIVTCSSFEGNYDTRLEEKQFRDAAVTILIEKEQTGEKIFMFTLFFLPYHLYKEVFFWKKENTSLEKKYMGDFREKLGDCVLSLGYARFSNKEMQSGQFGMKPECVRLYRKIIQGLLGNDSLAAFVEPAGILELSKDALQYDSIALEMIPQEAMGIVHQESLVSAKFAVWMGLKKMENLYHAYTLGPVYIIGKDGIL